MRIIKSLIAGIFFTVFLVISTSFIVSFVYEDEVSKFFMKEVNKHVKANITSKTINLSLLKKFPYATIYFEDFNISASQETHTDTLFRADELFLQFDIVDIFTGDYTIDKISIRHGAINIRDKQNWENPFSLKKGAHSPLEVHLKQLLLKQVRLNIENEKQNFNLLANIRKAKISGNFSSDKKNLDIDSEIFINDLSNAGFSYISGKNLLVNQNLEITEDQINFRQGSVKLENIPLTTQGHFLKDKQIINLNINGKRVNLSELNVNVPWLIKDKINFLTFNKGKISFIATMKGPVKTGRPYIETDFDIHNSKVEINRDNNLVFNKVSLDGYFSNGIQRHPKTSILVLNNIKTQWKKNVLEGNLKIVDFLNADLKINTKSSLKLSRINLSEIFSEAKDLSGNARIKLNYKGQASELKNLKTLIDEEKLTGEVMFENTSLQFGNTNYHQINGFVYLKDHLYFDRFQFNIQNSSFITNGKILNPGELLTDTSATGKIDLQIQTDRLVMDQLLKNEQNTQNTNFEIPQAISGNLQVSCKEFSFKKFRAENIKGILKIDPESIQVSRLVLNTSNGKVIATGNVQEINDSIYRMETDLMLNHIDIKNVFYSLNNFDQQYIINDNLKGYMKGKIHLSSLFSSDLKIDRSSLYCISDFSIKQGELINFEPIEKLASFVELEELKHVKFSELSNKITINKQKITIPEMSIHSSAFNLNISGWHTFDKSFSYRINLLLSEVLSKKARKKRNKTNFGSIQDDGVGKTRLYLKLYGQGDNYKIEYDRKGVKEKIREDIEEEKRELKQILHEEFGWFRQDSILTEEPTDQEKTPFNIQWEEDDKQKKKRKEEENKKKEKKKKNKTKKENPFIIKWEEDTLSNK